MNVTKATEEYIQKRPYVKQALQKKIINYSKLSKKIAAKNNLKNIGAIIVACRRYFEKIKDKDAKKEIIHLLSKSKLVIRTKIMLVNLDSNINYKRLLDFEKFVQGKIQIIRSYSANSIICSIENKAEIRKRFRSDIIGLHENLVEITFQSDPKFEKLPGVTAYLSSLFAEYSINLYETTSCYTDNLFIIEEKDLPTAMEFLNF